MNLSKSQYTRGLQCHKSLWLYKHRRDVITAPDQQKLAVFETGHEVGNLAKELFPGGTEIEFDPGDFQGMIRQTAALIAQGADVIYEASFRAQGVFVMADILVRNGDSWDIYEVKGSTKVKPYHKHDTAIQWFALSSELPLARAFIVHLNNRYVFSGELDVQQLFTQADVTETVIDLQAGIEANLAAMASMLEAGEPDIPIGTRCMNPFECDFKAYCWQDVPFPSVFNLYNLRGERKFELFHRGRVTYKDVNNLSLTPTQSLQVKTALEHKPHIEAVRLREFLEAARYPINFLDFETLSAAIPRFVGQRPYSTPVAFQYSLHILHADGRIEHREFLGDGFSDPRPTLVAQLVNDVTSTGSLVAFSKKTEQSVIGRLATEFDQHEDALRGMVGRFIDLIVPFRGLMYYHPDFNGDFSIKSILPAMFPEDEHSYKNLDVQGGQAASNSYAKLHKLASAAEREKIRASLLAYCQLDTLAMVKIWQELTRLGASAP